MNLEDIMLRDTSQFQKDENCMMALVWSTAESQVFKFRRQTGRMVAARGWGRGNEELPLNGIEFQFNKMKKVVEVDAGDDCTTQDHGTVCLKMVKMVTVCTLPHTHKSLHSKSSAPNACSICHHCKDTTKFLRQTYTHFLEAPLSIRPVKCVFAMAWLL